MKRTLTITAFLAMGLLVASSFAAAQDVTLPKPYFTGQATIGLLGASNVDSSKFYEYREVPEGISIPSFNIAGYQKGIDFAFYGQNVRQTDQRFFGSSECAWFGVSFDYNQIPHNMGNDGRVIFAETDPGVWGMSATLRQSLGAAVDATPSSGRTYDFYNNLLAPTFAAAASVDIASLRQTGNVAFDLGKKLPFDLTFTYVRDVKTGNRGESSGGIYGVVSTVIDVPDELNEVTQDFGIHWGYKFKMDKVGGSVYARYNRSLYNDRVDALVVDNPFRATDLAYGGNPAVGGPARGRFGTPPDNQAGREAFGFMLKFARMTRVGGDFAFNQWTQDAQYLPFTINSAILTGTGAPASSTASLPAQSLNGKINTTTVNFLFASRPIEGLGVRMRYRSYGLTNKTTPVVWPGTAGGSPERSWNSTTATEDAPYGWVTANLYDTTTKRFDAQVSYDIKDLTIEGSFRLASLTRTNREATSGDQNGWALSAVYHTSDWLSLRATYDWDHRTAEGETIYGFQADEAERKTQRGGLQVELTPMPQVGFVFSYFRRSDDYPNRPNRVAVANGVPVAGTEIADSPSGLLEASYNTYTIEFDYTPNERTEIIAYYTYEKNASTNQWTTTQSATTGVTPYGLNNKLNYAGRDRGDTFGLNATYKIVPDKWTVSLFVVSQSIDALMDITANETGPAGCCSFYNPGRTTLVPAGAGGAGDITDYDDTELTTVSLRLDYAIAKAWTASAGYAYENYSHADAFTDGTSYFPQSPLMFMKANNGDYSANVVYAKLTYRF